ncbi:hypothetical protein GHT06_008594 [Daphnia sinensis]|uniref:Secreted protein n=1 Tax=Daphnia sinensis TaxID=1820382 RepID=A0AAD5Q0T5_9CRUS|nr:hypothetical protein GHT06_008594 [Daphnia sinensis]
MVNHCFFFLRFFAFLVLRQTNQFSIRGLCFIPPFHYKRTKASTKVIKTQFLISKKKEQKKMCAEPIVFSFFFLSFFMHNDSMYSQIESIPP